MQNLGRVGKNDGPHFSRFGPKFVKLGDDVEEPSHFFEIFNRLSISCFVPKIFAIKSRRKNDQMYTSSWLPFSEETIPSLLQQIVSAITFYRLSKFG